MYEFQTQEFDLTEEEQEKAVFIFRLAQEKNQEWATGIGGTPGLEKAAFDEFKDAFYSSVTVRLGDYERAYGCWSLSENGKKIIRVKLVKK